MNKWAINSLVVYPKFETGAAENLWRAACGPRAALWPPLIYIIIICNQTFSPSKHNLTFFLHFMHTIAKVKVFFDKTLL